MNIKKEFDELTESLKQQRGEIQVQNHLANMDAKEEWQKAEGNIWAYCRAFKTAAPQSG